MNDREPMPRPQAGSIRVSANDRQPDATERPFAAPGCAVLPRVPSPARGRALTLARCASRCPPSSTTPPSPRARRRDLGRGADAGDRATRARRADPLRAARGRRAWGRGGGARRRSRRRGPRTRAARLPRGRLGGVGARRAHRGSRPGPRRPLHRLPPGDDRRLRTDPASRGQRPRRLLRLRHDDPDRPRDLAGRAWCDRHGADRGRPGARRASRWRTRAVGRPGHHAAAACFGGSCYLNNAAAAAVALRARVGAPVAVLDIDAHHGNGTQQIFYEDPTVLTGSVHVDPGGGWFPHFLGFERETGAGPGCWDQPQPLPRPGRRRRRVARGCHRSRRLRAGRRGASALVVRARGRSGRRRPGGAPRRQRRRLSTAPAARSASSACRPWSSRRAATTWRRSASSSPRRSPGSRRGSTSPRPSAPRRRGGRGRRGC